MKNFFTAAIILFAFTLTANAQDNSTVGSSQVTTVSFEQASKADVAALDQKVALSENLKTAFYNLMLIKYQKLSNPGVSQEEKDYNSATYERKILSGISAEQRQLLLADPALIKRLTH